MDFNDSRSVRFGRQGISKMLPFVVERSMIRLLIRDCSPLHLFAYSDDFSIGPQEHVGKTRAQHDPVFLYQFNVARTLRC